VTPTPVAPAGDYLTTAEVARRLSSTTQHVRQLIRSGRLSAIDIAKGQGRPRFRVPEGALVDFLDTSAVAPTSPAEVA
jgi:excisionase family DNA binding protein